MVILNGSMIDVIMITFVGNTIQKNVKYTYVINFNN